MNLKKGLCDLDLELYLFLLDDPLMGKVILFKNNWMQCVFSRQVPLDTTDGMA